MLVKALISFARQILVQTTNTDFSKGCEFFFGLINWQTQIPINCLFFVLNEKSTGS